MPFNKISTTVDNSAGGNFPTSNRIFFNSCGSREFLGNLCFDDAAHNSREVPIFCDDCLFDKDESHALLRQIRKAIKGRLGLTGALLPGMRSTHQNEYGYLPYLAGKVTSGHSASPAVYLAANTFGKLPNNQRQAQQRDRGQFLEYTFRDDLSVEARFVVDFRFGLVYMTLGHYHPDSFALLVPSLNHFYMDVAPVLPLLGVTVSQ